MVIVKAHVKGQYDDIITYEFEDWESAINYFESFKDVLIVNEAYMKK